MENTLSINESPNWIEKQETLTPENFAASERLDRSVFGEKLGFFAGLFGCRHRNISRPFNSGKTVYRCCLECGARKQFDPQTLRTFGKFYFPPVVAAEKL